MAVIVIVSGNVIVDENVIVAVHVNGNATVDVIAKVRSKKGFRIRTSGFLRGTDRVHR